MIGKATRQALQAHGFYADLMPEKYCSESLAKELIKVLTPSDRVLLARSRNGSIKLSKELEKQAIEKYQAKEEEITSEKIRELERGVMLKVVDEKWMNHIDSMDELKNGIGLRAYGQQDPVVKYRTERDEKRC